MNYFNILIFSLLLVASIAYLINVNKNYKRLEESDTSMKYAYIKIFGGVIGIIIMSIIVIIKEII